MLVELDNTRINYALTQNAGQDLRFVDADGTLLAHEIETWNESGTSYVWVSVPQIDASSGTDYIWMYYGNAAAADAQNADAVWDAGFSGVWHLNTDELDSAGTNDGINSNSTNGAGVIASGQSFNGFNAQVYTTTQFSNPQQYTIEAWFRTSSAGGKKIIGFENNQTGTASADWDRHLYVGTDGRLYFGSYYEPTDSEDVANSTTNYADGAWHYAVGVRNDGTDTLSLYVDGVLVDTSPNTSSQNYNGYWRLGGYKTNGWPNGADGYFNGSIDEARVSTQVRSAAWIKAQYLSMTDAFVGFSAAQGIGVLGNDSDPNGDALSAVLVGGPSNAASFTLNANGSFTYTPTANFSGTDSFTYRANDGTSNSNVATVTITVNPVNDAPVNTVPAAQVTSEDTTLVFSSGNGNRISIADVDAASGAMRVTLTATNGTLTLAGVAGLSFTSGRRHRRRHHDLHRNRRQHQHGAERACFCADRQFQRRGVGGDRHQRPGQHRQRRHAHRQRHREHHGQRGERRPDGDDHAGELRRYRTDDLDAARDRTLDRGHRRGRGERDGDGIGHDRCLVGERGIDRGDRRRIGHGHGDADRDDHPDQQSARRRVERDPDLPEQLGCARGQRDADAVGERRRQYRVGGRPDRLGYRHHQHRRGERRAHGDHRPRELQRYRADHADAARDGHVARGPGCRCQQHHRHRVGDRGDACGRRGHQ